MGVLVAAEDGEITRLGLKYKPRAVGPQGSGRGSHGSNGETTSPFVVKKPTWERVEQGYAM